MKINKLLTGIFTGALILSTTTTILTSSNIALAKRHNGRTIYNNSQTDKKTIVKFSKFHLDIDNYKNINTKIEYSKNINEEIATIIDIKNNRILEKITVTRPTSRDSIYSSILTRDFYFGNTILKVTIHVQIGNSGSFNWIEAVHKSNVYIVKHSGTEAWLSGDLVSAYINPYNQSIVNFSMSGTLFVKGDYNAWRYGYYNAGSGLDAIDISTSSSISLY